jgi:nicotinamide riboside kinase
MTFKVGVIGSHGTGKTTVIGNLIKHFEQTKRSYSCVPEIVRIMDIPVNEKTNLNAQRAVIHMQMAKELEHEQSKPDVIICDRSVVDNYAYLYHSIGGHHEPTFRLVKDHVHTYDMLLLCLMDEREIADDKFRSTDKHFQKAIQDTIHMIIDEAGLKTTLLALSDNPRQGVQKVLEVLP